MEYAQEAVKQGSAAVGLRSKTHAILLTLKVRHTVTGLELEAEPSVMTAIYWRIGVLSEKDDQDRRACRSRNRWVDV